ncbi:hypothetical protein SD78_0485 [Bacillus badius]|nr:hypothetical protein SD78_0485 [Bacillus badius]
MQNCNIVCSFAKNKKGLRKKMSNSGTKPGKMRSENSDKKALFSELFIYFQGISSFWHGICL